MDFNEAFEKLIGHEGGYVNHPKDPGGETMYGVTHRVARKHGYQGPMRELPLEKAKEIACCEYWTGVRADELPAEVRFDVFDTSYNSGPPRAIKLLQQAVGVDDDGVFGPLTMQAVKQMNGYRLSARFNGYRLQFLTDLNTWGTFGKGWARRVAKNLMEL